MNITTGKKQTPLKVVVYGPEGVGKTTFGSRFPGAVFIDTEGSTSHMDVARTDTPKTWPELMEQVKWFNENADKLGTLVIDTLDWSERLAVRDVCLEKKIESIEDIPYGRGWVFVKDRFAKLLETLDELRNKGVNIVLIAHSQVKKFELPDEMGSYDRYMLKLNEKNVSPLVKEWSDMLLFVNFKTDVITDKDGKVKKGKGGQKRYMYTQHQACWDAKNRFGLDDPLPFDYEKIAHLFSECPPVHPTTDEEKIEPMEPVSLPHLTKAKVTKADKVPPIPADRPDSMKSDDPEKDQLLARLWEIMLKDKVPDPLIVQAVVAEKEYYDLTVPIRDYDKDFIEGCLIEAWDAVNKLCQTKINDLPF